jgi:hypothetical protein
MNANLIIVSLISWGVGIITTYIGVVLHSLLADRKLKKRTCQVLYDELDSNRERLEGALVTHKFWEEHSLPYIFLLGSYMEARNCGIFRELPKELRESIEGCYSFLQFLNSNRFDTFARATSPFDTEVMNDLVKSMDEALPKLKEFCSNLRVYPHDDVAYIVRKIKRAVLRRGYPQT